MTDVIFNGSATRRSLGLAEVTMTFDDGRQVLASEADEVQIGRRVYRGGEGEYLINGNACRLKDIKDPFWEAAPVPTPTASSSKAASMCCYKPPPRTAAPCSRRPPALAASRAKKTETLRRLEHVDQNLQRLNDIVEEVDKQLRSVQLQAAKARRAGVHRPTQGVARRTRFKGISPTHRIAGREKRTPQGAADGPARRVGTVRCARARPAHFGRVVDAARRSRA